MQSEYHGWLTIKQNMVRTLCKISKIILSLPWMTRVSQVTHFSSSTSVDEIKTWRSQRYQVIYLLECVQSSFIHKFNSEFRSPDVNHRYLGPNSSAFGVNFTLLASFINLPLEFALGSQVSIESAWEERIVSTHVHGASYNVSWTQASAELSRRKFG